MRSDSKRAGVLHMLKTLCSDVERDPRRLAGTDSLRLRYVWQPQTHPYHEKLWWSNPYDPLKSSWSHCGQPLASMLLELEPGSEPYPCRVYFAAVLSVEKNEAEVEFRKHIREASNLLHRVMSYKSDSPVGDSDFCLHALFNIFGNDLSWEDNEEPGRPETWSQVVELPQIYEKLEWLLNRVIQKLDAKQGPKRKRRQPDGTKIIPLTGKQTEALSLFGELQGNYTKIGKRMGIGRKGAEQHVKTAYKKLGETLVKKSPKTTSLPTDKDGQANVSIGSEGQAQIRRNPRKSKPVRDDQ